MRILTTMTGLGLLITVVAVQSLSQEPKAKPKANEKAEAADVPSVSKEVTVHGMKTGRALV